MKQSECTQHVHTNKCFFFVFFLASKAQYTYTIELVTGNYASLFNHSQYHSQYDIFIIIIINWLFGSWILIGRAVFQRLCLLTVSYELSLCHHKNVIMFKLMSESSLVLISTRTYIPSCFQPSIKFGLYNDIVEYYFLIGLKGIVERALFKQ